MTARGITCVHVQEHGCLSCSVKELLACGRHGKGVLTGQGYRYDGEWVDDKQHGEGEPAKCPRA